MNKKLRSVLLIICLMGLVMTPPLAQESTPEETVTAFLEAWNANDLQAMYNLLDIDSQNAFALEVFQNRYKAVHDRMDFTGLTYTIHDTHLQGMTAAVNYDVVLESATFGEIEDPNRTIRLVRRDGVGWGVAWSSLDIFNVLAAEAIITSGGALPERANIYDRNGNPIAETGSITSMFSQRQNMRGEAECLDLLVSLTRRTRLSYQRHFANYLPESNLFLAELNTDVYNANAQNLQNVCGAQITYERTARRYYGNNAMGHVIGYVGFMTPEEQEDYIKRGYEPGDLVGKAGIESAYEEVLAGVPERVLRITEPGGYVLRELGGAQGAPSTPLQLTIDRDLQVAATQAMSDAFAYAGGNWGELATGGAAVVLDVKTGGILAMVSYPLIDPMLFDPDSHNVQRPELLSALFTDTRAPTRNHAIEDQYAPGSVFKIITAAAVLNEGITTPDETFDCQLRWYGIEHGDSTEYRSDWRETDELPAAGIITPSEAIMASCNPFFWETGAALFRTKGRDTLRNYARRMGLGQTYDLNMGYAEIPGNIEVPNAPDVAINDAIGQGETAVVPIQMAVAAMSVANGGTVYKPYIVQQIGGLDGTEITFQAEPEVLNTLDFEPGVLETLREGMCGATTHEDLGTAYPVFETAPYTVCGKTGTAEAGVRPNAWFIAFAPADEPQIAIVVTVPSSREGSEVAAPITRRILDYYFNAEIEPFPEWWFNLPYIPLDIPQGGGVG